MLDAFVRDSNTDLSNCYSWLDMVNELVHDLMQCSFSSKQIKKKQKIDETLNEMPFIQFTIRSYYRKQIVQMFCYISKTLIICTKIVATKFSSVKLVPISGLVAGVFGLIRPYFRPSLCTRTSACPLYLSNLQRCHFGC